MPIPREQLRLTSEELDELCATARTAHVATVSAPGMPHVVPMWFAWHDGAIWVNNLRRSRRSHDLASGSQAAVCIDAGVEYQELRGAVFYGPFADATEDPRLQAVRAAFAAKYWSGFEVPDLHSHVWMVLEPQRTVSWDFRKIPTGRDKRLDAVRDR